MRILATLVVLGLLAVACPANAQDGQKLARSAAQAGKQLQTLISRTVAAKGQLDFSRPPASELFGRIFDTKGLQSQPPPGAADVGWLSEWLGVFHASYAAILNFGADPKKENFATVRDDNAVRFRNELILGAEFSLRLVARTSISIDAYLQSLTETERNSAKRQQGLVTFRSGYLKTLLSTLQYVSDDIEPENERTLAQALLETALTWTGILNPEQRAELTALLEKVLPTVQDQQATAHLTAVTQMLSDKR